MTTSNTNTSDGLKSKIALVFIVVCLALVLSLKPTPQLTEESRPRIQKLWKPPNSWEPGDGHPMGYNGVDLSNWRK